MVMARPILIEECTRQEITDSLETLMTKLYETTEQHQEVTKLELIASLVYILMLETGYTPVMTNSKLYETFSGDVSFNINRTKIFCEYPRNWNYLNRNSIEMHFFLKPCQESFDVIVSMTTFGTGITLNLIVMNNITREVEHLFPYFISTVKYILNQNAPVERKFNNLRELSTDFKNKVAFPAKCTILNTDYKKHACLQYLPLELLSKIAVFLPLVAFARYMQTCKHLNQVNNEQTLWKQQLKSVNKERFKIEVKKENSGVIDWRGVCKEIIQHKMHVRRAARDLEWSYTF